MADCNDLDFKSSNAMWFGRKWSSWVEYVGIGRHHSLWPLGWQSVEPHALWLTCQWTWQKTCCSWMRTVCVYAHTPCCIGGRHCQPVWLFTGCADRLQELIVWWINWYVVIKNVNKTHSFFVVILVMLEDFNSYQQTCEKMVFFIATQSHWKCPVEIVPISKNTVDNSNGCIFSKSEYDTASDLCCK